MALTAPDNHAPLSQLLWIAGGAARPAPSNTSGARRTSERSIVTVLVQHFTVLVQHRVRRQRDPLTSPAVRRLKTDEGASTLSESMADRFVRDPRPWVACYHAAWALSLLLVACETDSGAPPARSAGTTGATTS